MQKTLEVLKNEDGLVIKRLSYKKLLFVYQVPILLGDFSDVVVGYLPVKIRYRTNNEPFESLTDTNFKCCDLTKLYRGISQKYQIKMNQIGTGADRKVVNIQGKDFSFDRVINSFLLVDPAWIRNYKLENLL
jgi:hypothetical protein